MKIAKLFLGCLILCVVIGLITMLSRDPDEYSYVEPEQGEQEDKPADMDWKSIFKFPTEAEITNHNSGNTLRSPYIAGWFSIPAETHYTEYMIDFKADYAPKGTYVCLGCWNMDYSMLEQQYQKVETNGISAYAGFQNIYNGDRMSIMSFWDILCTDANGVTTTIRAKRVYPESTQSKEEFDGEGTGAHFSGVYEWEENHWYRMHLKCSTSEENGNTLVEQWVTDLETKETTLLCIYDVQVPNSSFVGSIAVFLENYLTEYAGEVRTLEFSNAKYLDASTNQWVDLVEVYMDPNPGSYTGSYDFGVTEDRFWMITSGVGGDWLASGVGKKSTSFRINE